MFLVFTTLPVTRWLCLCRDASCCCPWSQRSSAAHRQQDENLKNLLHSGNSHFPVERLTGKQLFSSFLLRRNHEWKQSWGRTNNFTITCVIVAFTAAITEMAVVKTYVNKREEQGWKVEEGAHRWTKLYVKGAIWNRRLYGGGRGNVGYIGQRIFNVELPGTRKRRTPQHWFTEVIKEDRELVGLKRIEGWDGGRWFTVATRKQRQHSISIRRDQ